MHEYKNKEALMFHIGIHTAPHMRYVYKYKHISTLMFNKKDTTASNLLFS